MPVSVLIARAGLTTGSGQEAALPPTGSGHTTAYLFAHTAIICLSPSDGPCFMQQDVTDWQLTSHLIACRSPGFVIICSCSPCRDELYLAGVRFCHVFWSCAHAYTVSTDEALRLWPSAQATWVGHSPTLSSRCALPACAQFSVISSQ